jgi:hypothetical protein
VAQQLPQAGVVPVRSLLGDEVADELPAGEHVGVLPQQFLRSAVDHPVDGLAPQAGHFLEAVRLRVGVQTIIQNVEGAGGRLSGARDVGDQ